MGITRRTALGLLGALAAGCPSEPSEARESQDPSEDPVREGNEDSMSTMRTVYLPHGGGPWPFMPATPGISYAGMESYLKGLTPAPAPRALLIVSAHWEQSRPTLMGAARPPMLYDYRGFPQETYDVQWPAPGAPELAAHARELLESAHIPAAVDAERGFDHGTFVPTSLMVPEATIPTLQLSLKRGLDAAEHLAIGRAIAPLRDEGVFIVGSGMSYHNMGGFFGRVPTAASDSEAFDDWLVDACSGDASTMETRLREWERAPRARLCHPREEHLLPLMVIAGAAGDDPGSAPYRDRLGDLRISAIHFG